MHDNAQRVDPIHGCSSLFIESIHPVSSLHIYTFVVSRAFMAGAASQAGDTDSSRAPGLTSGAGVRECPPWCSIVGATVTVHQFFCILHIHTLALKLT